MTARMVPDVGARASMDSVTDETRTPSIAVRTMPSGVFSLAATCRLISVFSSFS
jgi:hypothetical protein